MHRGVHDLQPYYFTQILYAYAMCETVLDFILMLYADLTKS